MKRAAYIIPAFDDPGKYMVVEFDGNGNWRSATTYSDKDKARKSLRKFRRAMKRGKTK